MTKKLWLLIGAPGSGKSTWAKTIADGICISRDQVRFNIVKEDEEYFAHETLVFKTYVSEIQEALNQGLTVYADATHLNAASRNKLLNALDLTDTSINAVVFNTPLATCLTRNALRTGREFVPENQLRRMWLSQTNPRGDQKYKYNEIIEIGKR